MHPRILAILNYKGGVGKTTTCVNLACAYAAQDLRVLAIDLDPQSHLSLSLGLDASHLSGIDQVLFHEAEMDQHIQKQLRPNLDLISAGYQLGEIERIAGKGRKQVMLLQQALLPIQDRYDLILIDCPPTTGLLNFNALFSATEVIIPVSGDFLALQGLSQLLRTIKSSEKFMQKQLQLWIAITRFNTRRRLSHQVKEKLNRLFPDQLLATVVRENAPLAESPSFGLPIFDYRKRSNGAQDYARLADDILYKGVQKDEASMD